MREKKQNKEKVKRRRRHCEHGKEKMIGASVVLGIVILIVLLLFWVDIADILGWGDGGA